METMPSYRDEHGQWQTIEDSIPAMNLAEYFEPWTPEDRKAVCFYAVDMDNETMCKASTQKDAMAEARRLQALYPLSTLEIRFVDLSEEDFRQEDEERRRRQWEDMIYKPTPARTIHHRR